MLDQRPSARLLRRKKFYTTGLTDPKLSLKVSAADPASTRNPSPISPTDLTLRMINAMVGSYLDRRKVLTGQLEQWQADLLHANSRFDNWDALMTAQTQLHVLEDLCDEQHDAMQEWLDSLRDHTLVAFMKDHGQDGQATQTAQLRHDQLVAAARGVM